MTEHLLPYPYAFVFVFGTLIGSFLNVVVFRTPALLLEGFAEEPAEADDEIPAGLFARLIWSLKYLGLDLAYSFSYIWQDFLPEARLVLKGLSWPGSRCGHCDAAIAWYDNLPVISWFVLGGKCRRCKQPYSFRYPLIELLTGLLFSYVLWLKGLGPELIWSLVLVSALWAIFWIDLDRQFIFNVMTYPSILLGILYNVSKGNLKWSLAGGLLAWCLFEAIVFLSIWLLQKEGMGGGDVKLAVLLGVWLGPIQLITALLIAFVSGSLAGIGLLALRRQSRPFPFGPFMVLGALATMSVGNGLWTWYIEKSM